MKNKKMLAYWLHSTGSVKSSPGDKKVPTLLSAVAYLVVVAIIFAYLNKKGI